MGQRNSLGTPSKHLSNIIDLFNLLCTAASSSVGFYNHYMVGCRRPVHSLCQVQTEGKPPPIRSNPPIGSKSHLLVRSPEYQGQCQQCQRHSKSHSEAGSAMSATSLPGTNV